MISLHQFFRLYLCSREQNLLFVAKIWADTEKSRKILRLKESRKSERKDWRLKHKFSSSETAKYLQQPVFSDLEEQKLIFSRIITFVYFDLGKKAVL